MTLTVLLDTCVLFPMYLRDSLLRAARICELLRSNFPEAEVTGYEALIPAMECDPADRHVLAAAVKAGASVLATANLSDFPAKATSAYGIEVLSPDDFLLALFDTAPGTVLRTLTRQAERYKREPTTLNGVLSALAKSGAPTFADEVRRFIA